uniref:Uncharacterized protein n=1 Tax=Tanacetum cinerariifolium TaxID=118510 RepID=A0A6L2MED9_TANCI|nr:hypothetical protein [Tanacetum cinerariifolium]
MEKLRCRTLLSTRIILHTPKKARKFKKPASPSKNRNVIILEEEEPKPGGSGDGASFQPEVLDEPKGKSVDTHEGTGLKPGDLDQDDEEDALESDDDLQQSDDERTESENPRTSDNEEETQKDEYEMYSDVNVELKDTELKGERKDDEEMTDVGNVDAEHEEVNQEVADAQVKDDTQEIVTVVHAIQKTEVPLPSSSILSDYATKFLNFDNIPSADTEIISMMEIKIQHKDPSIQTSPLLTVHVLIIHESSTSPATTIHLPIPPLIPLS